MYDPLLPELEPRYRPGDRVAAAGLREVPRAGHANVLVGRGQEARTAQVVHPAAAGVGAEVQGAGDRVATAGLREGAPTGVAKVLSPRRQQARTAHDVRPPVAGIVAEIQGAGDRVAAAGLREGPRLCEAPRTGVAYIMVHRGQRAGRDSGSRVVRRYATVAEADRAEMLRLPARLMAPPGVAVIDPWQLTGSLIEPQPPRLSVAATASVVPAVCTNTPAPVVKLWKAAAWKAKETMERAGADGDRHGPGVDDASLREVHQGTAGDAQDTRALPPSKTPALARPPLT